MGVDGFGEVEGSLGGFSAVAVSGGLKGGRRNREGEGRGIEGERVGGGGSLGVKEKEGVEWLYIYVKITTKYPIIHSELYF